MADVTHRTLSSTLFHLMADEVWESLRSHMTERTYAPGDVIVEQGELEPAFHVIVDGVARVVASTPAGQERELGRLGFGECAGEMSLLTGDPASARVVAMTPARAYVVSQAQLAALGGLRTQLIEALSTILAARLKHANERLLASHPANVHVICCSPADVGALAGLADAIARTVATRVLLLVTGNQTGDVAQALMGAKGVDVQAIDETEYSSLPATLARVAHDYDEVLILGQEQPAIHQIAPDAASMLHVVRSEGAGFSASGHATLGQIIVIGPDPWTAPALRDLSDRLGRPVVALIPNDRRAPGHDDAIAKLARVITNRRVGLALGAGAAKGLAHLGVLRLFHEMRVPIDIVSGCSIGSAMAAGVAAGLSIDELTDLTMQTVGKTVRPTLPLRSFLSNSGVKGELKRFAGDLRIENLDLPLAVVATDIFRRSEVTFTSGLLWPRLLASMAIPGLYPPSAAMGSFLVDGGVLNPVPVRQCRELGAGLIIGVRLTATRTSPREDLDFTPAKPLAIETIMRTFEIMLNRISEMSNEQADVNIGICVDSTGGLRDFKRGPEIIEMGYQAAVEAVPAIREAIPAVRESA